MAIASAVIGVGGLVVLYEAGEHGGAIVYGYAGGVGTRWGDPQAVNRMFIAGAYQQALQDREAGRSVSSFLPFRLKAEATLPPKGGSYG